LQRLNYAEGYGDNDRPLFGVTIINYSAATSIGQFHGKGSLYGLSKQKNVVGSSIKSANMGSSGYGLGLPANWSCEDGLSELYPKGSSKFGEVVVSTVARLAYFNQHGLILKNTPFNFKSMFARDADDSADRNAMFKTRYIATARSRASGFQSLPEGTISSPSVTNHQTASLPPLISAGSVQLKIKPPKLLSGVMCFGCNCTWDLQVERDHVEHPASSCSNSSITHGYSGVILAGGNKEGTKFHEFDVGVAHIRVRLFLYFSPSLSLSHVNAAF
jgi:hypothetical protein